MLVEPFVFPAFWALVSVLFPLRGFACRLVVRAGSGLGSFRFYLWFGGLRGSFGHFCCGLLLASLGRHGYFEFEKTVYGGTRPIGGWDGITTSGTPIRVTELDLANESLTGAIPPSLGRLFELTTLDLSNNILTGSIPREIGWLHNLDTLKLSGNSLTGCIPLALEGVTTNDLSSLNLLYCQPPAPEIRVAGITGETTLSIGWTSVSNTSRYRMEHRSGIGTDWTTLDDTITATVGVAGELDCDADHQFRVRAYGSGTHYAAAWSEPSRLVSLRTSECVSPVFGETTYTFEIAEDAAEGAAVGTVTAEDPQDDTLTYSIGGGDPEGKFTIDDSTGEITTAGALDHAAVPAYTLTVVVRDTRPNTDTATVKITVIDVPDPPPAPEAVSASLLEGTFTITWDPLEGADQYRAQHRVQTTNQEQGWTSLPDTAATSASFTPAGEVPCETVYEFRVLARGDGTTYKAVFGEPSEPFMVTTPLCLRPPEFVSDNYPSEVREDAPTGTHVASVSAPDPNPDDIVTYSILSGNDEGRFAIDRNTGLITLAVMLDFETTRSYTLTIQASDGTGGTDTATVTVTVIDVAESAPPAPRGVAATLESGTFTITWDAMGAVTQYRVEYRTGGDQGAWATVETTAGTSATLTPGGGPLCGTTYEFQVQAYGDGRQYSAMWGAFSDPASVETEACNRPPEFGEDSYSFRVEENAVDGTSVGTVSADDADQDDGVTYSITSGNDDDRFSIDRDSGEITVSGNLDYESNKSHELVVQADDGNGGVDTAMVNITVTDVPEDPPPAPEGLEVSLSDGTFTITWTPVSGADRYEVSHRVTGSEDDWASLAPASKTSATYTPDGGPTCGTTYKFRVRAHGDGTAYAADWGAHSGEESETTEACNRAPEFGQSSYSFTILDDAATVGAVSAADPDDDTVSYSITAGNMEILSRSRPRTSTL